MKIPIDINIRTERIQELANHNSKNEKTPDFDDFTVSGTLKKTKGGFQIEFKEENDTVTTTIDTYEDEMVVLNRVGPINSHMVFADGKAHTCIYNTGHFPLQMRIRTKKLVNSLTIDGGKLDVDYSVEIAGNLAERNRITFSVSPDKSIIRS